MWLHQFILLMAVQSMRMHTDGEWLWEPLERVVVSQLFNLTEGTKLASDLTLSARNFMLRTNSSMMEIDFARHVNAKFALANVRLHQAFELEADNPRKVRNIFGSIVSSLTGLVTQEDLAKQAETEKQLEQKVKHMLEHELNLETDFTKLAGDIAAHYYKEGCADF
jgi:phosphopantetheine adenylyltransferase